MTTHLLAPKGGAVCGIAPVDAEAIGETFEIRKPGGGGPACRHCLERLRLQRAHDAALPGLPMAHPKDAARRHGRARGRVEQFRRQQAILEATPRPWLRVRTEGGWTAHWTDGRAESI